MLREEIAEKIIVDCGFGTEYPCPYTPEGNPFGTDEMCRHEDTELCLWQLTQADLILSLVREKIEKCLLTDEEIAESYGGVARYVDATTSLVTKAQLQKILKTCD